MSERPLTIGVTALNATDNPGPGVAVARALRDHPDFKGRIVGLSYDAMDPGIYARDLCDDLYIIPYPSQGLAALSDRIRQIHEEVALDAIIPNVDAELPSFIRLAEPGGLLEELGRSAFLPSQELLDLRSKAQLEALGERTEIATPKTRVLTSVDDLYELGDDELPYPLWIKGVYYGAKLARSVDEARLHYHAMVAQWGLPVIAQASVSGEEIDIVAVGDGEGGMIGAVPMKKTVLTDKGKAWAGITIGDPALLEIARRFFTATRWRGPCEIELLKDKEGVHQLLEVNPRFPAWCYLSAGAGQNLPYAVARLACGLPTPPRRDYTVGTMFVRIAIDQIATLDQLQAITTAGELHYPLSREEPHDEP
ncbi:MAG: ATP-grasp domain-containing protein [Myxococcales bacterium]|nr:ATP-grasp domain-containing protein [Myxococcales bacterium]